MPEKLLTVKQVQEVLDLSERSIFRLIKSGELKGFKVGREWRFEESDVTSFIKQQRQKFEQRSNEAA
jgi:excisionase family DNA binding protein